MDQKHFRRPIPTLYDDSVVIGEYASHQLQSCCFHNIIELVGLYQLHELTNINGVAAKKAATLAINQFNQFNSTRLTYDTVRDLSPTYAFAPLDDPIVYSDDLFELKKRACQALIEYRPDGWSTADFNAVNRLMLGLELEGIGTVLVYYPSGFWMLYKSPFNQSKRVVEDDGDQPYAMSEELPIAGIQFSHHMEQSYALHPNEEGSIKMEPLIARDKYFNYETNGIRR